MADCRCLLGVRVTLALLVCFHSLIFCVSLVYTSYFHGNFHVFYDPAGVYGAAAVVAAFTLLALLFIFASFSFGYVIAYYFFIMIVGYLWINCFTDLNYDRQLAGLSAVASAVAFFLPVLFITTPIRQIWTISIPSFDAILIAILALSLGTIVVGASYNFRIVSLGGTDEFLRELFHATFRKQLRTPPMIGYLTGIISGALLPFAFACYAARKQYWHALAVLLLLLLFFPITLSKVALFTPIWLVFIALLASLFEARIAVILSLLIPMLSGLVAVMVDQKSGGLYFDLVNFRLMTIPSNALAIYNDFFAKHDLTGFCQVSISKLFMDCPYRDQLGVVMERTYGFGNYNASLFATEGVASVGVLFAPVSVFVCGLLIALGNKLSAGLPPRVILMSSPILAQVLINVPFSTVLLTHGASFLFLLWYITPRDAFVQKRLVDRI